MGGLDPNIDRGVFFLLHQPPPQAAAHTRRCHDLAHHRCAAAVLGEEEVWEQ
jgi:hypothetical protein